MTGNTKIIGLYTNEKTKEYLDKGILYTVISPSPTDMGALAMEQIFSWKHNGYSNEYITTNINILKGNKY